MPGRVGHKPYRRRLRYDSGFYLDLQYCDEHGLRHSEFLQWSTEDRSKAIAFMLEKNARCVMCGTAEWEWDPKEGGSRHAYEPVQEFCRGCYLKHVAGEGEDTVPGTTIVLMPTGTPEHARRQLKAAAAERRRHG